MPRSTRTTAGKPLATSVNAHLSSLLDIIRGVPDDPGPEWIRTHQVMEALDICNRNATKKLKKLADQGLVEKKMFRVKVEGQGIRPLPFYRVVAKGEAARR